MVWIRHGNVILRKLNKTKIKGCVKHDLVLAEGEVTGHSHRLTRSVIECVDGGQRLVQVLEPTELVHEEHDSLVILEGVYEVLVQREVDLLGEVRQVMD